MIARLALVLAAGALLATPLSAEPRPGGADLPAVESFHAGEFAFRVVWPAGARRVPGLLAELDRAARVERRSYFGIMDGQGSGGAVRFERGARERFASDRLASLVVETRTDGDTVWARPLTWDLALDRAVGWRELLADAEPGSAGLRILTAFATARAGAAPLRRVGLRELRDVAGWVAPHLDAMPGFTLVPAGEPGRIAGLTLHVGERSGFGIAGGFEVFVPAAAIAPFMREPYRSLTGGEPRHGDPAIRRAPDEAWRGLPAFMIGPDQAPSPVLTLHGEAPASFAGPDGFDVVLYAEGVARAPLRARARIGGDLAPAGIAHATQPFSVTFETRDALTNSCRGEVLHLVPGPGSAARAAGLAPLALPVPIKAACEGVDG